MLDNKDIDVTSADWHAGYEAGFKVSAIIENEPDSDAILDPDTLSEDERALYEAGYNAACDEVDRSEESR